MKALQIRAFGDISGLAVVELPEQRVASDTAVVRVEAASINPSDVKSVQVLRCRLMRHRVDSIYAA